MKNGLYALASLDGRPLATHDLAVMGFDLDPKADLQRAPGCLLLVKDVRASAVHVETGEHGIDALLGDLDEPAEAARLLGLAASTDSLAIALAMVERFGDDASTYLRGEWVLARWNTQLATLTLLMAERVRDTCYVVTDGVRVAVSAELVRLARLDWVEAQPDPMNLMLSVGRGQLRRSLGNRTFLRDVMRVTAGSSVKIRAGDLRIGAAARRPIPSIAETIGFEEALERIDTLLDRIMRQHFGREGDLALSLSGGLDSSLLALHAARARGDRGLTFLTSAAPPGSGLADESNVAAMVATHLGVEIKKVAPSAAANVYSPSERLLTSQETPLMSARHYLDEALEQAALDRGAGALLNGYGGEMTVTHHGWSPHPARPLRDLARALRDRFVATGADKPSAADFLHIRPSRSIVEALGSDLDDLWNCHDKTLRCPDPEEPFGVNQAWPLHLSHPSAGIVPRLRAISPFHDGRLIDAVASMPSAFTQRGDWNRALARYSLKGCLPDPIAFRRQSLPYSPTYLTMLREQAAAARTRLNLFRDRHIDQWLNLDWIDGALRDLPHAKRISVSHAFELQTSVIMAEFLFWWGGYVS